jgi:hypothetical protein
MYGLWVWNNQHALLYTRTHHVIPIKRIIASLLRMYFNVEAHIQDISEVRVWLPFSQQAEQLPINTSTEY